MLKTVNIKISEEDSIVFQLTYELQKVLKVRQEGEHFVHVLSIHQTDVSTLIANEANFNYSSFKIGRVFNPLVR